MALKSHFNVIFLIWFEDKSYKIHKHWISAQEKKCEILSDLHDFGKNWDVFSTFSLICDFRKRMLAKVVWRLRFILSNFTQESYIFRYSQKFKSITEFKYVFETKCTPVSQKNATSNTSFTWLRRFSTHIWWHSFRCTVFLFDAAVAVAVT